MLPARSGGSPVPPSHSRKAEGQFMGEEESTLTYNRNYLLLAAQRARLTSSGPITRAIAAFCACVESWVLQVCICWLCEAESEEEILFATA